jgi:uncharacterized coiled-coil protein SlyX
MQPRPESRISSLEKRATAIEAGIEELSSDQAEELKVIRQDIKQLDERVQSGFLEIGSAFDLNASNIDGVRMTLETRLSKIEATQEQILKLLQQKPGE